VDSLEEAMASWVKCTTVDGTEVRLNMEHVALVRPYREDRGGTGSEVIFAAGSLSSIVVKEDQEYLIGPPRLRGRDQV
jgi:hypothetical protein